MKSGRLLLFMLFVALGGRCPAAEQPSRPDILLIMPDQMRGDCLSILGHAAVKTPQLDKLARQGVLFRRAYSTVPSCIPARYALLTGLHPQTSGVVGFQSKPIDCPTRTPGKSTTCPKTRPSARHWSPGGRRWWNAWPAGPRVFPTVSG